MQSEHRQDPHDSSTNRDLERAFGIFNQLSTQLTTAYQALEERTARLNAELAAARSERLQQLAEKERLASRLETLLNALPAAVVVLDGSGCIAEYNPVACDFLGEPLMGRRWAEVFDRAFVPRLVEQQELSLRDGRRVHMSQSTLGAEPGRILLFKDVTEARVLQERLGHHQRLSAMGEMTASLAHQIRTPLAVALLYSEQLLNPGHAPQEVRRYAEKIRSRLHHLEALVNDMLLFARDGSGGEVEPLPVGSLLHEFSQAMETYISAGQCSLTIVDETHNTLLHGYQQALLSVLQNLATNAMQACNGKAQLALGARSVVDGQGYPQVLIALSDNGPGVPVEIRERIFEPFFTTRCDGTGLGLAVVQSIVHAHHGSVRLESVPGKGSTFILSLPVFSPGEAMASGVRTTTLNSATSHPDLSNTATRSTP
ncbi:MAG: ATP-binding protein [Gammaproteobacteria bacterium]|nr:ATP-binding protein [Gammaproteobacteria bacterium]